MGGKNDTPDFGALAAGQGEENEAVIRNQIYANRPTQYTPWGANSWEATAGIDPATGEAVTNWENTMALSPELQDIYNKQVAIQGGRTDIAGMLTGRMGSTFGTQMDLRGINPIGYAPQTNFTLTEPDVQKYFTSVGGDIGNPYETRQAAEDAVYGQAMSRIAPQQESQRGSLEMKMRNQGLKPGDAAWQNQIQSQGQQFNDQNNQALWSANQAGMAESSQMYNQMMGMQQNKYNQAIGANNQNFNQGVQQQQSRYNQAIGANNQNFNQAMTQSKYSNQIRQQQLTEAMQLRGFELNEINALLSGQQVGMPQMPSFAQAESAVPADIIGSGVAQANAAAASDPTNALIGAAGTAAGLAMSDRRMKYNIKRIGTNKGYPWYSYNLKYDGSAHEGVMADEIPEKYTVDFGGLKAVNYGALLGE